MAFRSGDIVEYVGPIHGSFKGRPLLVIKQHTHRVWLVQDRYENRCYCFEGHLKPYIFDETNVIRVDFKLKRRS